MQTLMGMWPPKFRQKKTEKKNYKITNLQQHSTVS